MTKSRFLVLLIVIQMVLLGGTFYYFEKAQARADAALMTSVPHLVSYQGVLADGDGNPIDGLRTITVTVYDVPSGGAALWGETHPDLVFSDGNFSVLLGSVDALPDDLFDQTGRWLEIQVDGVTLSPRQQFTAAPYALNAEKLDGLDGNAFAPAAHPHLGSEVTSAVPLASQAMTATRALDSDLLAGKQADTYLLETWELGEADVDYRNGILTYGSYYYPSDFADADFINNFTPPAITKTVHATNLLLISREGSYPETFTLVFEARDFAGTLKRTISAASVDLKAAAVGEWVSVPLSANPADWVIYPGEYLAVHVARGGAQGGDLIIWGHFQAIVK